ncbi:disintegrin and metalloproteinase domain-containing protein 33-like isoform X2 [Heptranchias perlo]|uniref:disintegrin and metalloproteinase domain-containing protein 33-like isoform X2 n=1 Tax=Heptranchias perlo TaxID=212740 RepID=UPI00355A25B6
MSLEPRADPQPVAAARPGPTLPTLALLGLSLILGPGVRAIHRELTQGDPVVPYWLGPGQSKQEITAENQIVRPDRGSLVVFVEGRELVLEIERNDQLIASGFTESHYDEDGTRVTITPNYTEHCLYQGHVRGHGESWLVLSLCSGVSGLVVVDTIDSYYLEPIREENRHIIYRTEHLPIRTGTCGHGNSSQSGISVINQILQQQQLRVRRDSWDTVKYVELFIVADNSEFRSQLGDLIKTKERILEIANFVDKFYRTMNIRIALIGLEVWTESDQITMSEDPNTALWAFLKWRQKLWLHVKHDNTQLITGIRFKGTTIGMAPLEGMCSQDTSGGVNMDHSSPAIGAAATMAHEIGHNFGMNHDGRGCCARASAQQGGCIMAAATGHPFPRVFSGCSQVDLRRYFQRGGGMCLYNMPDMNKLFGGHRCGNGYVEDQEECDCGDVEECVNPCCNANNCTLRAGAQCAHGVCCKNCKLKSAGTVCRNAAGSCDLPEYCTGASAYCPFNVYRLDGSSCDDGRAYCYTGMCQTHHQQCEQLWGPGARPAPTACFEDVNAAGNDYGNCGKDSEGTFVKCDRSDAMCGKIQCQSSAKNPKERNTVSIDTTIRFNGREVKCRGAYLYSTQHGQEDLPDPGLVKTGTKCGDGKVCMDRRCQLASFLDVNKCVEKCHGHGVCNSNKNCHCEAHWAPPYCDKPGLGGSIDSGPVHRDNHKALLIGLLITFLMLIPAVLFSLYCCYKRRAALWKRWKEYRQQTAQVDRTDANSQTPKTGLYNPSFHMKKLVVREQKPIKLVQSQSQSPLLKSGPPARSQPVNIVRPLIVAKHREGNVKPCRPAPPPIRKSTIVCVKLENQPSKLGPPRKPLPLNPRTQTQPWVSQEIAPQRPLPLKPAPAAKASWKVKKPLLVQVPLTGLRPVGPAVSISPSPPRPPACAVLVRKQC